MTPTNTSPHNFKNIRKLLGQALRIIEERGKSGDALTGTPTGFADLDNVTLGLQNSDLTIIASRPREGKTTLAMNIAEHIALNDKKPVAIFSMEVSSVSLIMRMLSSISRISIDDIHSGNINEDDWPQIGMAVKTLGETKIFIYESCNPSIEEIKENIDALIQEKGELGLIVIDPIQAIEPNSKKANYAEEMTEVANELSSFTKKMKCPVIGVSQLDQALEGRPNKRPRLSDMKSSCDFARNADTVLFVYRDEIYHEDNADKGIVEVIVAKQKIESPATVRLMFKRGVLRFDTFTPVCTDFEEDF